MKALSPGDDHVGRTLEPGNRGIVHTMIRAHLWLALGCAVVGAVAFGIMIALGVQDELKEAETILNSNAGETVRTL